MGDNDDVRDAAKLVRALELFQHNGSPCRPEEVASNSHQKDDRGGGCDGYFVEGHEEGNEFSLKQGVDLICAGDKPELKQGVDLSHACGEDDEAKVAALARLLQENDAEKIFSETTG